MGNEIGSLFKPQDSDGVGCCDNRSGPDRGDSVVMTKVTRPQQPMSPATAQRLHGVGLVFRTGRDGRLVVASFIRDSSAYECGLVRDGDILCEVDGRPIEGMQSDHLDKILLGRKDTWVQMKFHCRTDAKAPKIIRASEANRLSEGPSTHREEPSLGKGAEDTRWASSKMRSFAPTYQTLVVDLCRTTPSNILTDAVTQATEEDRQRNSRKA